jgi:hypothetical protein
MPEDARGYWNLTSRLLPGLPSFSSGCSSLQHSLVSQVILFFQREPCLGFHRAIGGVTCSCLPFSEFRCLHVTRFPVRLLMPIGEAPSRLDLLIELFPEVTFDRNRDRPSQSCRVCKAAPRKPHRGIIEGRMVAGSV